MGQGSSAGEAHHGGPAGGSPGSTPGGSANDTMSGNDDSDDNVTIAELRQRIQKMQTVYGNRPVIEVDRLQRSIGVPEKTYVTKSGEGSLIFHFNPSCRSLLQAKPGGLKIWPDIPTRNAVVAPTSPPWLCYTLCHHCALEAKNYIHNIAIYDIGPTPVSLVMSTQASVKCVWVGDLHLSHIAILVRTNHLGIMDDVALIADTHNQRRPSFGGAKAPKFQQRKR